MKIQFIKNPRNQRKINKFTALCLNSVHQRIVTMGPDCLIRSLKPNCQHLTKFKLFTHPPLHLQTVYTCVRTVKRRRPLYTIPDKYIWGLYQTFSPQPKKETATNFFFLNIGVNFFSVFYHNQKNLQREFKNLPVCNLCHHF